MQSWGVRITWFDWNTTRGYEGIDGGGGGGFQKSLDTRKKGSEKISISISSIICILQNQQEGAPKKLNH